jgi:hypothetical protein
MFNLQDYETVEERLVKYWKDHPDGRIDTHIVEASPMRFIIKASIYRTEVDAHPWTTGFAEETVAAKGVNATSALENCETVQSVVLWLTQVMLRKARDRQGKKWLKLQLRLITSSHPSVRSLRN